MNEKLLKLLTAVEPEMRKAAGNAPNATVSISIDENGATYSFAVSDQAGANEVYSKRIPVAK